MFASQGDEGATVQVLLGAGADIEAIDKVRYI
jgi:hypothetical protein